MFSASAYSLFFLVLTMGARYLSRPFVISSISRIFGTAILGMVLILTLSSATQYHIWARDATARFLLSPHTSHWYFLEYIGFRFWMPYILALIVGTIIGLLAYWYNKRHGSDLLYDDEPYIIALALFLVGHPGWIFYFTVVICIGFLVISFRSFAGYWNKYSFYDLWLPVAAFVILIMQWLSTTSWFLLLKP